MPSQEDTAGQQLLLNEMPAVGHADTQGREGQAELRAASSCSPGTSYQSFLDRTPCLFMYLTWSWGSVAGMVEHAALA